MTQAVTPKCVFKFPKLHAVDYGSREYPVPNGQYVVTGVFKLADPQVQAFVKRLEAELEKAREAAQEKFSALKVDVRKRLEAKGGIQANALYKVVYDQETEQPTGEIEIKFQLPYKVDIKKGPKAGTSIYNKPIIVAADGTPIPANKVPEIWGGTEGIIAYSHPEGGYFIEGTGLYGLKLRLVGVQLIKLVAGGERSASSLGFTAQEGLSVDDLQEREEATEESTEEDTAEGEGANEDF
jgi:hypothetical protein